MQEQINRVKETALEELAVVTDLTGLDEWRIKFLGKKGELTGFLRSMGAVSAEERPAVGQAVNAAKVALESAVDERAVVLKEAAIESNLASDRVDVTLPGRPVTPGYIHIINKTLRDITESFTAMGFQVYEGPEVELDYYNFELLNMPPGHPARSMHDTFYFSESTLLRTHTSPNQIRVAEKLQPPIRIIVPGKCYRSEATDATHEFMFYQCELMVVDKNVTLADLRGTLADFARRLFGQERKVRFRCDYFPYVEPGVDLSIDCGVCKGVGCRSCKYTGWLEIMGAGMIHPQVLRNVGIDPEVYSGYAAGMGPERISMLKYGIDDIRQFYRNDLRFLSQFA
ncbi:MAG: phenylalanine--tRNA ligase subunit alpha [Chloroflexi bacterium]|uniref:Phenylalanine--tRNA ligase alpha subunit n=1 Tax=Candidatus Chlorohelix allophototropha TaxID=3003348 RepID=A0A8T7LV95_9CHLR|nr:phenylalanine--tRNA ligase subunit alpha [Chloroflexota bacterium]